MLNDVLMNILINNVISYLHECSFLSLYIIYNAIWRTELFDSDFERRGNCQNLSIGLVTYFISRQLNERGMHVMFFLRLTLKLCTEVSFNFRVNTEHKTA